MPPGSAKSASFRVPVRVVAQGGSVQGGPILCPQQAPSAAVSQRHKATLDTGVVHTEARGRLDFQGKETGLPSPYRDSSGRLQGSAHPNVLRGEGRGMLGGVAVPAPRGPSPTRRPPAGRSAGEDGVGVTAAWV